MILNTQFKFKKLFENKRILGIIIILLAVIIWGLLNSKFSFDKYDPTWDMRGQYDINSILVKESIVDNHQFPLWVPYIYGGTPYFQYPQAPVFNIANILIVLLPSFNVAFNLLGMLQLFIIGITMYFLIWELKLDYKYSIIGAFTFMFNRYNLSALTSGGELHFDSIVWLPAIFFFLFRAYKNQEWIKNSIFAGIFSVLAFHAGDVSTFTYMLFFISLFFIFFTLISLKKYKKMISIFIVFSIVLFGLSAIRLFPLTDFGKVSDLSGVRSFESAKGYHIQSNSLFDPLVKIVVGLTTENGLEWSNEIMIGIFTFILALLALPLIKNKYVLFFVISIVLLSNVAIGSHLFYFLWKFFPGFNKQHHIIRVIHLVPFCFSVLSAFGFSFLFKNIASRVKKKQFIIMIFLVLFILLLIGLPYEPPNENYRRINMEEEMNRNELMVYLNEFEVGNLFRVHQWDMFNHIGGGGQSRWVPMGISTIHGQLNTFESEYLLQFINPIAFSNPSKILGMYNTKYFYSDTTLNNSDLVLTKEFESCDPSVSFKPDACDGNFGPYLYLNKRYVPRAYRVNNTILVLGGEKETVDAMYSIILGNGFSPANLAIIPLDINELYEQDEWFLLKFDAVILLDQPKDVAQLKQYSNNGGILMPNIFNGETSLKKGQIDDLLNMYASDYGSIEMISVSEYKPNSIRIDLDGSSGFVVVAEKYFLYDGWGADDNRVILRTNGFSSGVFVDSDDYEIEFSYFPRSFKIGMIITLLTLFCILFYFIFLSFKNKLPKDIKTD
jgi:hypothetical protein